MNIASGIRDKAGSDISDWDDSFEYLDSSDLFLITSLRIDNLSS